MCIELRCSASEWDTMQFFELQDWKQLNLDSQYVAE